MVEFRTKIINFAASFKETEDMKERKETINLGAANVWSIALFAVAAIVCVTYYGVVRGWDGASDDIVGALKRANGDLWWSSLVWMLVAFVVLILGAAVHELVHGIVWAHYAKSGWRSISFGVMWKALAPYCHCSEPLKVPDYRCGALAPLFIVGILPAIVAPFFHSPFLLLFGIIYIAGASGDLMVVWRLRKENPENTVLDHPTEAGYLVYEEE